MRRSLKLFVHGENVKSYTKQLMIEQRPEVRKLLLRLLEEEHANGDALILGDLAAG